MNITFGICCIFNVLGQANQFYFGDFLKYGLQPLKDPQVYGHNSEPPFSPIKTSKRN
jgi:hypothetical protein